MSRAAQAVAAAVREAKVTPRTFRGGSMGGGKAERLRRGRMDGQDQPPSDDGMAMEPDAVLGPAPETTVGGAGDDMAKKKRTATKKKPAKPATKKTAAKPKTVVSRAKKQAAKTSDAAAAPRAWALPFDDIMAAAPLSVVRVEPDARTQYLTVTFAGKKNEQFAVRFYPIGLSKKDKVVSLRAIVVAAFEKLLAAPS